MSRSTATQHNSNKAEQHAGIHRTTTHTVHYVNICGLGCSVRSNIVVDIRDVYIPSYRYSTDY